ncbi:hypothetical protein [Kamptonema formosum]|uniref:hypothetical protein n=1 Tax=Kamptonema formosum TaxID=331992 RepID=UPI000346B059|nr:hypothetical protein [Oscillatoria sp. PCC 10802]
MSASAGGRDRTGNKDEALSSGAPVAKSPRPCPYRCGAPFGASWASLTAGRPRQGEGFGLKVGPLLELLWPAAASGGAGGRQKPVQ